MSRTFSRLISGGEHRLKLLLEPVPGQGADLLLRHGGFFAGFEKLEDLYNDIEKEHSKRTASASAASAGNKLQALSTGSSAGDAHGRCTVFEEPQGAPDSATEASRHSVKSAASGQPDTIFLGVKHEETIPARNWEIDGSRSCHPDVKPNVAGSEDSNAEHANEEDFEGNVDAFNVRNSMLEPVSIFDLRYEGCDEGETSSYLYGNLENRRLKMQKISYFKFWFDDKQKREPEVWMCIDHHTLSVTLYTTPVNFVVPGWP